MLKVATLAGLALFAFAANSVFARLALGSGEMDAAGYTGVRLTAGAVVLYLIMRARNRQVGTSSAVAGSWAGAGALFGYAISFSAAYLMLGTGTGALILFASVQAGMLVWAFFKGDRPGGVELFGMGIAFAGLIYLVSPGLAAPDPLGALLMIAAGLCWAAYSLLGRGSVSPLADTAGNFIRCLPVSALLALIGVLVQTPSYWGLAYAMASGALASGVGYAIWYAALPSLTRTRAAVVQLTVPAIAALGGVIFIGEDVTARLLLASAAILGGVGLALVAAEQREIKPA